MANVFNMADLVVVVEGRVDQDATMEKFAEILAVYAATMDGQDERIAAAVAAVFDANKGATVPMPALQSFALVHLNAGVAEHKALTEKVGDFIRANAGAFRREGKLFKIGKGKGGGVFRWADRKEDAAAEEKEYQEYLKKEAAKPAPKPAE